jgi:hypothetical protein
MKTIILTALLTLMVSTLTLGNKIVAKGSSNSAFGNYKIEKMDDHKMLQNKELDQYMITYENSDLKVMVVLDKQKSCKKYYVLNDQVSVQYECNGIYLGIKKLDKELVNEGMATTMESLNRGAFYHQKVIAGGTTNTVDHLTLIASYYPELVLFKAS